jgi:hypothetical protein
MKTYVLVWHPWNDKDRVYRQAILDALDKIPSVVYWRASTGAIFIGSDATDEILSEELANKMPNLKFVISEITLATSEGRTDRETWSFIGNPARKKT